MNRCCRLLYVLGGTMGFKEIIYDTRIPARTCVSRGLMTDEKNGFVVTIENGLPEEILHPPTLHYTSTEK